MSPHRSHKNCNEILKEYIKLSNNHFNQITMIINNYLKKEDANKNFN